MLKKTWSCNICREEIEGNLLFGVRFRNNIDFTLGEYLSTEGIHICYRCARQLRKHLLSEPITELLKEDK